jgi:hypothetical protein
MFFEQVEECCWRDYCKQFDIVGAPEIASSSHFFPLPSGSTARPPQLRGEVAAAGYQICSLTAPCPVPLSVRCYGSSGN